jgi:uncharacterized protein (DUF1501 family)
MDGLAAVVPYADPAYASQRGALAMESGSLIRLDGQFALHPSMVEIGKMYAARQALLVHAIASPYRERSHFDGQNVLETGGARPYAIRDGWLNRLITLLPESRDEAIALAPTVPLALRGSAEVTSYAPSTLPEATDDLLARVTRLYEKDAQLHPLWSAAMQARDMAGDGAPQRDPAGVGKLAATFLSRPDGPRIAMIETGGWDTHSAQNPRLAAQLRGLDALLAALRDGLGSAWSQTVVLVATEFGRTVAVNGTNGTDHGTASAAMLMAGAVRGGRVIADWPGLAGTALHEGRDLRPTASLEALILGVAAETFALDSDKVAAKVFPGAAGLRPMSGLVA